MTADELLTVPQAAGYLGIRAWTLRHWISNHKIEVVGGQLRNMMPFLDPVQLPQPATV